MIGKLTIGRKLMAINVLSALVVLLVAGGLLLRQSWEQRQEMFEQRIVQQGNLAASTVTAAVIFEDWETAEEILHALTIDPAIAAVTLIDGQGVGRAELFLDNEITAGTAKGDVFFTEVAVVDNDQKIGRLLIFASNAEVASGFRGAVISTLLLTVISLCLGLLLSSRTQKIVTDPIRRLSELTRRVRKTKNYSLRLEPLFPDEVGALTEDLNAMMTIIDRRDRELGQLVAIRTRELEDRNDQLQAEIVEREKAERGQREVQGRFEKAFHNAPIGMGMVASDGHLLQRNQVIDELLGIGSDSDVSLQDFVVSANHGALEDKLRGIRDGGTESFEWETACHNEAGDELHCILSFSPIWDEQGSFRYTVLQIQDVTEAKRLSSELSYQASHDALTGLANRRVFDRALNDANDRCAEKGRPFALCLLDLDQFKVVNDTCGHAAGDGLLQQVSELLIDTVRSNDLVVRLGGDEFAVLLFDCSTSKAGQVAEKIRAAIEDLVFTWEGSTFRIGVSIGVVAITESLSDTSEIMRTADSACFAAKDAGRNQVYVVEGGSEELNDRQGEMHWVQRIHRAIDHNDFVLFCQPVLPLQGSEDSQRLEVLLRLRNRDKGTLVPPGAFLPVAERYDLTAKLDNWVVRHLVKMLQTYAYLFEDDRNYWVNLSGRSIGDARFLASLEDVIENAHLPPGVLNFEITETAVIRNIAEAARVMHRLRDFGCRFALDDFGSGLSSFGYLRKLPIDYIKIDGMFVRDIVSDEVDRIFVKSIIDIAKVMGIKSVAEFVENDDILKVVTELGADYGQGFALGRPRELFPQAVSKELLASQTNER